jgi:hypothetical protein
MIPKTFNLAGCKWTVKMVEEMTDLGRCDPATFTIYIKKGLNPSYAEQTFYHELTHAIMFTMGRNEHDEVFVDCFGVFLHQFNRSKK